MKAKITFILVFSFLFLGFKVAFANVVINEIKYSPISAGQWVEIYNDTDNDVDITTYKILDNSVTNGHSITPFNNGSNLITKHGFGVIAKFPENFNAVSFPLFKSSLNIKVSEDKVVLKNDSGEIDSVDVDGSALNGNSLQKISGTWVSAIPTPGTVNESSSAVENFSSSGNENDSTITSEIKTKKKVIENPTIKAKILTSTVAFTGQPLEIKANILGYSNEDVVLGKTYWSFGDGGSLEQINNFEKINHIYYYPGEYALILEYYSNNFSKTPDATSKMIIKVLSTTVTISKIGDEKDFFIELTNNATSDIDISGWIMRAGNKVFVLPRNTVILSNKKITLSNKITNFTYGDQYILKLFSMTGDLIFDYNNKYIPTKTNYQYKKVLNLSNTNSSPENSTAVSANSDLQDKNDNFVNDLVSAPILSENNENGDSRNFYFFFGIFIVLLIFSGGAVYYIRQRKNVSKVGDDFKIIDE